MKIKKTCLSKKDLNTQKKALEKEANVSGQPNDFAQKLTETNEALKHNGELDPAFRLNKHYRNSIHNTK